MNAKPVFAKQTSLLDTIHDLSLGRISANALINCAADGDLECEKNLGIFYAYSIRLPDGSMSKDNKLAEIWLSKSTFYPSSRFVLAKIFLESGEYKYKSKMAESLLRSSCSDGEGNACYYLYEAYAKAGMTSFSCKEYWCDNSLWAIKKALKIASREEKKGDVSSYTVKFARILIKRKDPAVINVLEKAVSEDTPFASMLLAPLYATGELVPKDLVRAYMLYDLTGSGYADEKEKVAAQMTPDQIRKAQEMSWRWQDEHHSYRAGYRGSDMGIQWKLEKR